VGNGEGERGACTAVCNYRIVTVEHGTPYEMVFVLSKHKNNDERGREREKMQKI